MGKYVQAENAKSKYTVDVQAPAGVEPQFFPRLSPGMKRLMGIGETQSFESVYPRAEVQEYWRNNDQTNDSNKIVEMGPKNAKWRYQVEPGKKLYPRGQIFVRANGVILYDQPNPYFHRRKPFALLDLLGVPWQQYAMSVVQPWHEASRTFSTR